MQPRQGAAMRPVINAPATSSRSVSFDVLRRARAEYDEMPGLHLTEKQAARLWGCDADSCRAVLAQLESVGFLAPDSNRRLRPRVATVQAAASPSSFEACRTSTTARLPTLVACLTVIRDWSRSNPGHVPVLMMIEAKDGPFETPMESASSSRFRSTAPASRARPGNAVVFARNHLLTPDRVRGKHPTLAAAIQADGWPLLRAVRGKVLFALDNTDEHRRLRARQPLARRAGVVRQLRGRESPRPPSSR